jgi:hypothetical protein
MERITIEYHGWHSMKEELGEDVVFFDGVVYTVDDRQNSFPVNLPYRMIEKQVEETIPSGSSIVQNLKRRTKGWGPQESEYIKELQECGVDLEMIFKKALEQNIDLEKEAVRWKNLASGSGEPVEITNDLEAALIDVKTCNEQYYLLCLQLEKVITDEVVRLFPVLLNSSSDNIRRLNHVISQNIPDLADELNNLIFEAGQD